MKSAYLDNNIIVDIENNLSSIEDLLENIDEEINVFFYSVAHIQEANEIIAETNEILKDRLKKRFETISLITNNNYLYHDLTAKNVFKLIENPDIVYETINKNNLAKYAMKSLTNLVSEEQKDLFRTELGIHSSRINNYSPEEVITQINAKSELFGGYTLINLIEKAIELNPQGKEMGLNNRFAGIFEILDLVGYWKDKYNEKSNYARLWDSNHCYYSAYCDYFISNDKRTRNKAKVVFHIYGIKTKILSSLGKI